MIIGSKAMIVEEQVKDRANMGSKFFEAHTNGKFVEEMKESLCEDIIKSTE